MPKSFSISGKGKESEGYEENNFVREKVTWHFCDEDGNIMVNANTCP